MTERYYAQHTEVPSKYRSSHSTAWQIFDRNFSEDDGGDVASVALCVNRRVAFAARDALNAAEKVKP